MTETLSTVFFIVLFLFATFPLVVSRSLYRYISPEFISRDGYAHLFFTRDIKSNSHRIPESPSQVATNGKYSYPYLMHWILSFLPMRHVLLVERYLSPIMDLSLLLIIFSLWYVGPMSAFQTSIAIIVFVTTPEFVRPDAPHNRSLSARKPGLFLTSLSLLSFSFWVTSGDLLSLIIGVLTGGLVYLTSKFSVQALVFVLIGLGLGVSWHAITVLFGTLIIALILSRGSYFFILRSHMEHLYEYAMTKQHKMMTIRNLQIIPTSSEIKTVLTGDASLFDVLNWIYRNPAIRIIFENPFIVAVATAYTYAYFERIEFVDPVYSVWILACFIAFVFTSLPYLRFMGKGHRYLEYAVIPSTIVIGTAWTTLPGWFSYVVIGIICIGIVIIFAHIWSYNNILYDRDEISGLKNIIEFLNEQEKATVLVQPTGRARAIAWETEHDVIDIFLNNEDPQEVNLLFPERYGRVTEDISWLKRQYNPEWVVFDKTQTLLPVELTPPAEEPVFSNEYFEVYSFSTQKWNHVHADES